MKYGIALVFSFVAGCQGTPAPAPAPAPTDPVESASREAPREEELAIRLAYLERERQLLEQIHATVESMRKDLQDRYAEGRATHAEVDAIAPDFLALQIERDELAVEIGILNLRGAGARAPDLERRELQLRRAHLERKRTWLGEAVEKRRTRVRALQLFMESGRATDAGLWQARLAVHRAEQRALAAERELALVDARLKHL